MTPDLPPKQAVYDALLAHIRERLARTREVLAHASAAATDSEARAENKYDTRGLEMSFVAAGQSDRIATLRQVLSSYHFWQLPERMDTLRPGALARLVDEEADQELLIFIAPYGDADQLTVHGHDVRVITLKSPLGLALVGKELDDEVEVVVAGVRRCWWVAALI